jgi:hypothetical protein
LWRIASSCTIRQTMRMTADCSSDWPFRRCSLLPPLLIWAPAFVITFHVIYCFICVSTVVVRPFHFVWALLVHTAGHQWVEWLADQRGCSDRSLYGHSRAVLGGVVMF